jgi:hypothetical protein
VHLGCGILNELLSTEDLLLYLNHKSEQVVTKKSKKPMHKNKIKRIIFGSIVILAVLHLVFMALPMISKDLSKEIFNYQYVIAISKVQDIDEDLTGEVVRLKIIDKTTLNSGDRVLVFGLYDSSYYWEVEILDNDITNQEVEATFDDVIRNRYSYDEIEGIYTDEANIIGIFYYTASTPRGFITMIILHALIVYIVHYVMFKDKNKILKDQKR